MRVLLDTNILTRLAEPGHAMHREVLDATRTLGTQGHALCIVPQNLYEFWVVCTRPVASNGLGRTAAQAAAELTNLKSLFTLLDDTPPLYSVWEQLVAANSVQGRPAYDARLVAAMLVHGVTHLLTFNDADFLRFTGITILTPAQVLATPAPATPVSPIPPVPPTL